MKFYLTLCFFIFLNELSFSQVDTILIQQLEVTINGLPEEVNTIIVGSDYTFLQNYEPSNTLFTYKNKPFTGVAQQVDTNQITYIGFQNGIVHGRWFDETIWNGNLRFEGKYVNGEKSGQWIESFGNNVFRIENYENNRRNGVSKIFIDVQSIDNPFYSFNASPLKMNLRVEEEYKNDELVSETFFFENGEKIDGELKYSSWNTETLDTLTISIEYFKAGKFQGKRLYCYESEEINAEFHLLETGAVMNKEINCNTGEIMIEGIFIPKKVFTSHSFIFEDEFYERQ